MTHAVARAGWVGLMLLCVAPYPFTTIILDTARDLVIAARIGGGEEWPLRGPIINAVGNLGPGWYYLLAPVLALTASTAATLAFVGLLDALKFPLAFVLGTRLGDRRLGASFALAMALPNWALVGALLATHTSVVQTAVLATALCALRLSDRDTFGRWLTLGLMLAAALHAHPATLVLFPLLGVLLWQRRRRPWRGELRGWAIAFVGALLPFLPMLVAEMREGWPLLQHFPRYTDAHAFGNPLALASGSLFGGTLLPGEHLAAPTWRWPLHLMLALAISPALIGLALSWSQRRNRRLAATLFAALALGVFGLALLRERTPFYMSLLLWPPVAGLLAVGWDALAAAGWQAWLRRSAMLASVILAASASGLLILRAEQGLMRLPTAAIFDVAQWRTPGDLKALLPAWRQDRLGRELCAARGPVVLHAEVGTLFDAALGLGARLDCGDTDGISIGGGAQHDADHRLGLPPQALRVLGLHPAPDWPAALRLAPTQVIAGSATETIPDGRRYPFRPQESGRPDTHSWQFESAPEQTLLVTTPFRPYDGAQRQEVRANGVIQYSRLDTYATSAYRCDDCVAPVRWHVRVRTGHPQRVDIVLAEPELRPEPPASAGS